MAVTTERSDVFANLIAAPPVTNARPGMPIVRFWSHTQGAAAGDINSTIEVWRIPAGSILDVYQSIIANSAYGASRVLSLGYRAYTEADGTAITASLTGLLTGIDVATAAVRLMGASPAVLGAGAANGIRLFRGTADLVLQVTGGTIPAAAVTSGRLVYYPGG